MGFCFRNIVVGLRTREGKGGVIQAAGDLRRSLVQTLLKARLALRSNQVAQGFIPLCHETSKGGDFPDSG